MSGLRLERKFGEERLQLGSSRLPPITGLTSAFWDLFDRKGLCLGNSKAKLVYSRTSRRESKQVVGGLVLDGEGFPKAHNIFAGAASDGNEYFRYAID